MHAKDTLKRASNDEDAFRSKSVEWVREDVVVDRRGDLVNRGQLVEGLHGERLWFVVTGHELVEEHTSRW